MKVRILFLAAALGLLGAGLNSGLLHPRQFAARLAGELQLWMQLWEDPAPTRLPPLAVETLDREPMRLTAFQGKPLVLNLWASWCPPCRQEMPVLEAGQDRHPGLDFVFLNQGETGETIARYLAESGLDLAHVLRDPDSAASKRLNAAAIPTTLFFDAEGWLVKAYTGELTSWRLERLLRALERPHTDRGANKR